MSPRSVRRVVVVYNPRSGAGRAVAGVEAVRRSLRGHDVVALEADESTPERLTPLLEAPAAPRGAALVVVGGDGTVSRLADVAARTGAAVYHVPTGTENLFARQWGMTRSAPLLAAAVDRWSVVPTDLARVNGRAFVLMWSSGPDAAVVHRAEHGRGRDADGAGGHGGRTAYVLEALRELGAPTLPAFRITVDGRELVRDQRGWVVVANSPRYGGGLDPVPEASPGDGLLDVAFMPACTRSGALAWALRARLGRLRTHRARLTARGRHIRVVGVDGPPGGPPAQVDGEALGVFGGAVGTAPVASFTVEPGALRVLRP
jgi:diacylglycerol kinase (ATP)